MSERIKIIKPSGDGHSGDTFRELLDIWEEKGYVKISHENTPHVWWGGVEEILLYDRPVILHDLSRLKRKGALFANTIPSGCRPWTFWARSPRLLEKRIDYGVPTFSDREVSSIFLGKVENNTQRANRVKQDWGEHVEEFSMPILIGDSSNWPYSKEEYLDKIALSKFGLCLPGYGPKCNREIEYMGLGVVPIITPGVDLTYHEPPVEGVHYLKVSTAAQVPDKTSGITEGQWTKMSLNCRDWYKRNCAPEGSFNLTRKLIS